MTDIDAQCIVACEILSFALLSCMEWHWGMPMDPCLTAGEESAMMNVHDEVYLERLAWVVYNGTLLPGDPPPMLSGTQDWSHVMDGTYKYIY